MKHFAIIAITLAQLAPALAQQPPSGLPPAPTPTTDLSVKLPIAHWNTVLEKLRKAPYEEVADIIAAIMSQGQQQGATRPPPPGAPPAP